MKRTVQGIPMIELNIINRAVVPNGSDIVHRWALKRYKGAFLAKANLGAVEPQAPAPEQYLQTGNEKFY